MSSRHGFTIIELVVVIAVIVMVVITVQGVRWGAVRAPGMNRFTRLELGRIAGLIDLFEQDSGRLPNASDRGRRPAGDNESLIVDAGNAELIMLLIDKFGECGVFEEERLVGPEDRKVYVDHWKNAYIFRNPGIDGYMLYSSGRNGIDEDGAGDDVTIQGT